MGIIALPKKITYQKIEENHGLMVVEPCFPGYGVTLGNAIRRVLLSSLPGSAPIGVKIQGVSHEFMALDHMQEDVLELILNLKQLRLKVHGEEEVIKLELDVHGEKEVKAGDIKKNAQVEIMNPDLVLAHLTDIKAKLKAEIFVASGMGYETIESREHKKVTEVDLIEMDSIYSPVLNVGIKVENVRVGKMTNWDKLILDITTDGTIDPESAFNTSVKELIDQFSALDKKSQTEAQAKEQKEEDDEDEEK